jgi:mannose/fructose/N-acetylgalactosamine-specific phosphotransferase system component IIC
VVVVAAAASAQRARLLALAVPVVVVTVADQRAVARMVQQIPVVVEEVLELTSPTLAAQVAQV